MAKNTQERKKPLKKKIIVKPTAQETYFPRGGNKTPVQPTKTKSSKDQQATKEDYLFNKLIHKEADQPTKSKPKKLKPMTLVDPEIEDTVMDDFSKIKPLVYCLLENLKRLSGHGRHTGNPYRPHHRQLWKK
jgi:hypothetical protein